MFESIFVLGLDSSTSKWMQKMEVRGSLSSEIMKLLIDQRQGL